LRSFLLAQKKDATLAKMQEEVSESYQEEHSGQYMDLYDEKRGLVYQSDTLRLMDNLPEADSTRIYVDRKLGDRPLRFLITTIPVREHLYRVRLGVSVLEVRQILDVFRRFLLTLAPILFTVAASVGYWLSRRALVPMDRLTQAARLIGSGNLTGRLDAPKTGDELQRLADTLNDMLDRIETSFRRITAFTADPSHELRTPISLIRTQP